MTKQLHSGVYIKKKTKKQKRYHASQSSQQHYLKMPEYGTNPGVHQQKNG